MTFKFNPNQFNKLTIDELIKLTPAQIMEHLNLLYIKIIPTTTDIKPSEPIDKPSEPINKPSEPINKPSTPVDISTEPVNLPSELVDLPPSTSAHDHSNSSPPNEDKILPLSITGKPTAPYISRTTTLTSIPGFRFDIPGFSIGVPEDWAEIANKLIIDPKIRTIIAFNDYLQRVNIPYTRKSFHIHIHIENITPENLIYIFSFLVGKKGHYIEFYFSGYTPLSDANRPYPDKFVSNSRVPVLLDRAAQSLTYLKKLLIPFDTTVNEYFTARNQFELLVQHAQNKFKHNYDTIITYNQHFHDYPDYHLNEKYSQIYFAMFIISVRYIPKR